MRTRAEILWGWTTGRDSSSREVHLGDFVVLGQCGLPILGLEGVYMNRAIGRLCSNEFVKRVPSNALHVMIMLSNLADHLT